LYGPDEWDALSWDVKRAYLSGLESEGLLGYDDQSGPPGFEPTVRQVDTGQEKFDLGGMITDLEAEREKRRKEQAGGG
jgi:hypothetical protein